ncbi:DUF7344 domain-containing protein [Natrinema halophilum]|uniref:DUF7344 domain-containing protein n=1 Tax=Natrinema halophilum TaxID=1699371 RepID=A0A7D5GG06_9EURY|nr:hypothetical protein [Natrinema halophilum]QLG48014.1 hypothetical protein HYG82_03725 [Natrinema halophilum]
MSHPKSERLEIDTVYTLLSNATRRAVLCRLHAVERTTTRELVRYLTDSERGDASSDIDGPGWVASRLIHDHLPRLDDLDVIDYGGPDGEVAVGPAFDGVEPFVARLERAEP